MFCKTDQLCINQKKINILKNISINIEMGATTAIIGKNGSGKTTLLKCLNCLIYPSSGKIYHKFNQPFPMLFQKPLIFNNTLEYNFRILSNIKKIQPLLKWYDAFNLDKLSKVHAKELSGGEKQKIFLSRIFSINSEVIIMDEPNLNLDLDSESTLINLLKDEKKNNKTIIFAMHDYDIVKKIADKIILLDQGSVIFSGDIKEFF